MTVNLVTYIYLFYLLYIYIVKYRKMDIFIVFIKVLYHVIYQCCINQENMLKYSYI
jgi:hypothetical protein